MKFNDTPKENTMNVGTRVSYEDMANPLREGTVVEVLEGAWGTQYRVAWDDGSETAVSDCRQRGWKVLPPAADSPEAQRFARDLRNFEAMYRRLDRGELTGRNSTSSDLTRERYFRSLRKQLESPVVCAALDANPKLAARWDRLERRSLGLRV